MSGFWDKKIKYKLSQGRPFKLDHRHNDQWCERHWAPYRGVTPEGVEPNGAYAATMISHTFLHSPEYLALKDKSVKNIRRHMRAAELPLCCRLGDSIMDKIFGHAVENGTKKETDTNVSDTANT